MMRSGGLESPGAGAAESVAVKEHMPGARYNSPVLPQRYISGPQMLTSIVSNHGPKVCREISVLKSDLQGIVYHHEVLYA